MSIKRVLTRAFSPLKTLWHTTGSCYDPVCQRPVREFRPHGKPARPNARCPLCGSLERHRLAWLVMQRHTPVFGTAPRSLLHFAPEPTISAALRKLPGLNYLSVDLAPGRAMQQADITALHFESNRFDLIYCSHVLEHIPDDRQAMRELFRVLAPGGMAIIQVPERGEHTFEDAGITTPDERERAFGQWDHVRWYGADITDRLSSVGFSVERIDGMTLVAENEHDRLGLTADQHSTHVYLCRKPETPAHA